MSGFPTGPAELTLEWLSKALGRQVTDFSVARFGEGTGVVAQVTRAELQYAEGVQGPGSVIVKFPSPSPENRAVGEHYDMYAREVRFYTELAERIPVAKPACYHAELDVPSHDFALVIEDVGHLELGDQVAGCRRDRAELVIDQIARMHAACWDPPASTGEFAWLPVHDNPAQVEGMREGFRAGWPVVLEQFGALVPSAARPHAERMPDVVHELLARMCEPPIAVVHGDMRLDNLFFGHGPDEPAIVVVDWQAISKSCGEQDLAYFLTQNLRTEERRAHESELVRLYWEKLGEYGVRDYPFERCQADYRLSALYLLCYAVVIAGTLDLANERGTQLAHVLIERSFSSLLDLDAFELLPD